MNVPVEEDPLGTLGVAREQQFVQPVKSGYGATEDAIPGNVSVAFLPQNDRGKNHWQAMVGEVPKDRNGMLWLVQSGATPSVCDLVFGKKMRFEKIAFNNSWLVDATVKIWGKSNDGEILLADGVCDRDISFDIVNAAYFDILRISLVGSYAGNASIQNLVITAFFKP